MSTNSLFQRNLSLALPPTSPLPAPPPPTPPRAPLLSSYDVFLSFRGEDVRGKFIDHLYARLQGLKVNAFMDNKKLARGEIIEKSILTAIERSKFSVVVFSSGYANSEWCLDELVKIVRCGEKRGHVAMPVFFHVSPDDVAGQSGVYEEAFVSHEKEFKKKRVENWRKALIAVAGISGWCFGENESEATLVEEISKTVQLKLKEILEKSRTGTASIVSVVNRMKSSWARSTTVKKVNLFSYQILENIAIIRVCGLGGLESTRSAKLVYDNVLACRESSQPSRSTFRCEPAWRSDQQNDPELKWSQKIWDEEGDISTVRISGGDKKVLAVVDDVEKLEALLQFAAKLGWFGSGSRVVLSTVDESKKILKVIHIYMEGPPGEGGGGDNGNCASNSTSKYLDVACFMKEMVAGEEVMKRVVKSLNNGGLSPEIVVKVRIEKFENVVMVENGKLEIVTTRHESHHQVQDTVIPEREGLDDIYPSDDDERLNGGGEAEHDGIGGGSNGTLLDEKMVAQEKSQQRPRVMQISFLMFAFVFVVSRLGPRSPTAAAAARYTITNRTAKFLYIN